jgi:23S rRNA (uracil747-C5)-methyltransferase
MHCHHYDAARCRSCTLLPIAYNLQLAGKDRQCRQLLSTHLDVDWLPPVASAQTGFRNKAKMVVSGTIEQPILGIIGPDGHGVDLSDCPLYPEALQRCFPHLAGFIRTAKIAPYDIAARRGELKYLLLTYAEHSGELMLRFVVRSQEPLQRIRKHLPELHAALPALKVVSINLQPEHKAIVEGEQEILLSEQQHLTMRLNGLPLHLRPQSFFQTNSDVAAQLYAQARDWVVQLSPKSIWDLFCGVGGFALHCADGIRSVTGIETSSQAIASAERSRDELGLHHVQFRCLDATEFSLGRKDVAELVIVNPPRRGIGPTLCEFLEASGTRWLIYSSCNAQSMAQDLARMPGFELRSARVLDMFPNADHYEVITLLARSRR